MSIFNYARRLLGFGGTLSAVAAICGSGVVAFGFLAATPAHAEQCHFVVDPVGSDGAAGKETWWCDNVNNLPPATKFAAIAVSESRLASGSSWSADSRSLAEGTALFNCGTRASGCKVVDWASHQCLALAVSYPENVWGVDSGDYPESAMAKATEQCRSAGGKSCVIQTHPCSDDPAN